MARSVNDLPLRLVPTGDGFRFAFADAHLALSARKLFVTYVEGHVGFAADLSAVELIFAELVSNVARHAPGAVEVQVRWLEGAARLEVHDRGPGYTLHVALPDDPLAESHRGLFIVAAFASDLCVERRGGRTVTAATVPLCR